MRVAVVGCGPSGLTAVKQLLDEGHEVTCFDKNESIGGIWYRSPRGDDTDEMKVFDNLILTISMKMMSYSDHMVEGDRIFYTQRQYAEYLESYAARYDLRRHIRFKSVVTAVEKNLDRTWTVTVVANGETTDHVFDAVAICSGPFQTPSMDVSGLKNFTGEVVHSSRYRNADRFKDKRVLIVGLAESGADLVREISNVTSECTLGIHSYSGLLPRLFSGTHSTDAGSTRWHHWDMYTRASDQPTPMASLAGDTWRERKLFLAAMRSYGVATAAAMGLRKLVGRGNVEDDTKPLNNLGQPAYPKKIDIDTEWTQEHMDAVVEWNTRSAYPEYFWAPRFILCKNVSFIPNIVNGKCGLNDSGIETFRGNRVYFKNGESKEIDAVVLCTGFKKDFSLLKGVEVRDNNVRNLYKHCFHPDHDGRLAFIGFLRPYNGGVPICAEMQARYFALLCSNKIKLPANLRSRIQREKSWEETFSSYSPKHTEAIPSVSLFLDGIAREIGCLMSVSDLVKNPRLLVRHWFYPFNQACYRLVGPHAMPESAMRELMSDKPGPLTDAIPIFMGTIMSMLPRHIHPTNERPPPRAMNFGNFAPKSDAPRRDHPLRPEYRERGSRVPTKPHMSSANGKMPDEIPMR